MNNSSGLTKGKKITIISLLLVVIILLALFLFLPPSSNKTSVKKKNITRTLMIYMVGSNLESESSIASADLDSIKTTNIDLDKNNVLLYVGGTKVWHNYISNNENAIYKLTTDGFQKIETFSKLDMGSSSTLSSFLEYGYKNFKTDAYDLLLYDHGGAIDGAIYDDFTSGHLELTDFANALDTSPFNKDNKLELVLFRTCLNGTLEVANIFKDYAEYMVSSEETTYGSKYTPVLGFISNMNEKQDTVEFAKSFISEYTSQITDLLLLDLNILSTYSIIDLSKVDNVTNLVNEYFAGINLDKNYNNISKVRSSIYQYAYGSTIDGDPSYDTVDLYTLTNKLSSYSSVDSKKLLNAIDEMVVYNKSTDKSSNGISIYFPYNGDLNVEYYFLNIYKNINSLNNYNSFINSFISHKTSSKTDSYNSFNKLDPKVDTKTREFELNLTDEQVENFSRARYIVFEKNEDNTYTPIYSSDNVELSKNTLKTKIQNNLIKIVDIEDGNKEYYLSIASSNNDKTKTTSVVANSYDVNKDMSEWFMSNGIMYFEVSKNKVNNTVIISSSPKNSKGYSGAQIDESTLTAIDFIHSRYIITDANGNYDENWDNKGVVTMIEVKPKKYELKVTSLDEGNNYYAVFRVEDIYGNKAYSNLIKIN